MSNKKVSAKHLIQFSNFLREQEKSPYTIEKYSRDVRAFLEYANGQAICKEIVM